MGRDTCLDCGKPLGSTIELCHTCGGESRRGGKAVAPHFWQVQLGVKAQNLRSVDFEARKYGTPEWDEAHGR